MSNTHKKLTASREPVIKAAAIGALVGAVLSLLISFGVPVTGDQVEAIKTLAELLAPIISMGVAAVIARSKVTPVNKE